MKRKQLKRIIEKTINDYIEILKESSEEYKKVLGNLIENAIDENVTKFELDNIIYEYLNTYQANLVSDEEAEKVTKEPELVIFSLLTAKENLEAEIEAEKNDTEITG